jgi:uncharacterized protein
VKADPFVQLRLLDLQVLDSSLDRLAHRRRTLPELAEIERLDKLVDGSRDEVVRAETEVGDLAREARKFEDEIDTVRTRKTRDEQRLSSGAITNSKQLQELEHEVGSLNRRQAELEDRELEVMERAETVQTALDKLLADRDAALAERAVAEDKRDAGWAEIDAEVARVTAERAGLAGDLPADLVALYEKIRAEHGGSGAGPIERGRCGACRLDLMGNEKAEIRAAPAEEVLRHEECGRIMVRTAESGL